MASSPQHRIAPGYLALPDLAAEQLELDQLSARHAPPAGNWTDVRRRQVSHEIMLRHDSEVSLAGSENIDLPSCWPASAHIDVSEQIDWLTTRYSGTREARIPLPRSAQQLWGQHKYSILARDQNLYRQLGRQLADKAIDFSELADLLTSTLLERPTSGGICNAVQHMWGYVSQRPEHARCYIDSWSTRELLHETQQRARTTGPSYLWESTALSELMAWLD
ncbi:DUF1722 domain-containing protein [Aidingimonas halophila]|uniref:DUF1722 domain-containing protein n=1 Tax=Aidingimonas halophila TaxID=574349 RepID=A0A1H2SK52_9GAMM|nr:DUF1722 domain-containing protein [Aidingimonas halophila]GHC17578.1 hypothetical protein GCM10008094_04020 [Aidingimonas halophila]SDW31504.1 Protein of unknown function [Aidingimonas halophila]